MRTLLNFPVGKKQKVVVSQAIHGNVVSTIKKQNQKIEKRLSDCMREIQQQMSIQRSNKLADKLTLESNKILIMIKPSLEK